MGVSYDNTQEATTEDATDNLQQVNLELKRLLDARAENSSFVNQTILEIHRKTERKVENQTAQKNEFYGNGGKLIKEGAPYHIHYTRDLEEYYMTGAKHKVTSKLIFRVDSTKSDFGYYNNLNKQSPLIIKSTTTTPTEEDYNNRFVTRYFAKKANETLSPVFEVSGEDFESSPLYNFVSLDWYIKGKKSLVLRANKRQVYIAGLKIPNVGKLLPEFQYFRTDVNLSPKESVVERLGTITQQSEESTTQSTTQQTTTQQAPPTGPPPGVTSGGAGGAGGY